MSAMPPNGLIFFRTIRDNHNATSIVDLLKQSWLKPKSN